MHMHIDADAFCQSPRGAHAEIRHLGPHTGQGHQALRGVGDVACPYIAEDERCGFDVARLGVVETDGPDQLVECFRRYGEDGLEREARGWELGLEAAHGDGGDGVFGLRGEHEGNEGLESLVLL